MKNQTYLFFLSLCMVFGSIARADVDESYHVLVKCDPTGLLVAKVDCLAATIQQVFHIGMHPTADGKSAEGSFSGSEASAVILILKYSSQIQDVKTCDEGQAAFSTLKEASKAIGIDVEAQFTSEKELLQTTAKELAELYSEKK